MLGGVVMICTVRLCCWHQRMEFGISSSVASSVALDRLTALPYGGISAQTGSEEKNSYEIVCRHRTGDHRILFETNRSLSIFQ